MKKFLQIPLLLVALFLSSIPIFAYEHDFVVDGIYYHFITELSTGNEVEVTHRGYDSFSYSNEYSGNIIIPSMVTYGGTTYSVTRIGHSAFEDCTGLTSVTIPNSVTEIGSSAFEGCTGLTEVTIPNSVTEIGYSAFKDCTGLTSITIPNTITSIDKDAFKNTGWYNNQDNGILYLDNCCLGYKGDNPAGILSIKEDTRLICNQAFSGCTGLTSVTIPNSVTSICYAAFHGCTGLTEVTIPNSVTGIGSSAFKGCTGLTSVTIPSSVTEIGSSTFEGCSGLTSVTIPNSVTEIGYSAFKGCTGLTEVTIPNSVTEIGSSAFEGCSGLTSVTIPNSVTEIGYSAFEGCSGLTSVTIPNSVTEIGYSAFEGCSGLISVTIPSSVTEIGSSTFEGCSGLTSVTIPNSVTEIGNRAFFGCTSLNSIEILNSKTLIGYEAFYNTGWYNNQTDGVVYINNVLYKYKGTMPNNTSINIKEGTVSISRSAFEGCSGLTEVTIPNSVTEIGYSAFEGCSGLTSVTIPNSVTEIGYSAFEGCSGLTSVTIPNSVTVIGSSAFEGCTGLTEVTIPNSVTSIGGYAFSGCSGLTEVNIGNSVTSIGGYAFSGCSGLTNLILEDGEDAVSGLSFPDSPLESLYLGRNTNYPFAEGKTTLKTLMIGNMVSSICNSAFHGCTSLTSITIPNSVTTIGENAFHRCTEMTSATIGNSVTKIGDYAFNGCSGLTTISIPNSVTEIGSSTFMGCTKLVTPKINTTQTTATINLISSSNCPPYLYCDGNYYKDSDTITGLIPELEYGREYSYSYGLEINGNYCKINTNSPTFKTSPIYMYLNGTANATSITANGTHSIGDATFVSEGLDLNSASTFDDGNEKTFYNLDPNTSYNVYYGLKVKENTSPYSVSKSFTTGDLDLTTQEAKPTSTTSVRLLASTNCDATEGTGFEWRRYDAPAELPSSKVTCPVVDGVLVGSLRGVKDDVYYKYRPYYTSSSGKTYYGDWIAFFTGDANVYFEPEVHTYSDFAVTDNSVVVKGYALEGTDVITAQGFEYWKTGTTIKPSSTDDRMTVNASGISMSATLANLEYNSTYKYRAFVTTAKGTVYGDEVEFSTGDDPAGIGYIKMDSDEFAVTLRENPATGTAWVNIAGAAGEEVQYTITSMSGAMVATGSVMLDGEWNAIDLNCPSGLYLLTINDSTQIKTLRLIVK